MLFDDASADGKPKTRALALGFGGEEGIKDLSPSRLGHTRA
jgi:hypothetical protein